MAPATDVDIHGRAICADCMFFISSEVDHQSPIMSESGSILRAEAVLLQVERRRQIVATAGVAHRILLADPDTGT